MGKIIGEIVLLILRPISKLWSNRIDKSETPDAKAKTHKEETADRLNKGDSAGESADLDDLLSDIERRADSSQRPGDGDRQKGRDADRSA